MKRSLFAGLMVGVASMAWGTAGQAAETASNDPQRADDVIVTGARPA